jgi:hypothetical protein
MLITEPTLTSIFRKRLIVFMKRPINVFLLESVVEQSFVSYFCRLQCYVNFRGPRLTLMESGCGGVGAPT